jgi:hypothetical protein
MKCSSLKHSGSETKILPLGDTRARIGPKMRSPRLLLTGWAPKSLPKLQVRHWATPTATTVTKSWHLCTQLNSQGKPEQLKFSKTDPSTWP